MLNRFAKFALPFLVLLSFSFNAVADDAAKNLLQESIKAHGGIEAWRSNGVLKFQWIYHISDKGKVVDTTQQVDPVSMSAKHSIANSEGKFGFVDGEYWQYPADLNFNPPPRFWTLTPIYFLGIPFVFDDDKTNLEILSDKKEFNKKQYTQLKITFEKSAGDSPDDYYVLLIDPETKLTRGAYYTVTSPLVNKTGKVVEKFISLDNLKDIKGLKLSSGHRTYRMDAGVIGDQMRYTEVKGVEFLPRAGVDFSASKEAKIIN